MKNKYAGVTLDWYDDNGLTLKSKFPTAESLPGVIKEASVRPKETLDHDDFALVAIDEGHVMRKFACHDPGTTAMSVIYFMEHGDKLPEGAQKMAAANLVDACVRFDLAPPAAMEKAAGGRIDTAYNAAKIGLGRGIDTAKNISKSPPSKGSQLAVAALLSGSVLGAGALAGRKKDDDGKKKENAVDITGQRPAPVIKTAMPESNEDYAVVMPDGARHYPIDSWDRMKTAEVYFSEERMRMHPEVRRQFATKLAAKATQIGYPLDRNILDAGSTTYADEGLLTAAIEMRKMACAPQHRPFLDDLFEKRAELAPEVYSEVLRRFDIQQGLDRGWDQVVLDPWTSTYGMNKTANVVWEQGADRVTEDALKNMAVNNHLELQAHFNEGFFKEFIKDPVGIFNSMPDPQKKILARMANDSASSGESETMTSASVVG